MIELNKGDDNVNDYVLIDNAKNQVIKAFLLITSVEDIYFELDTVMNNLSDIYGQKFSVIIDHFITNGFSFNRFARIDYSYKNLKKSLVTYSEIGDFYENEFFEYLKKHSDFLSESSLSKRTISIIQNDLLRG